jgi:hypothetical protein
MPCNVTNEIPSSTNSNIVSETEKARVQNVIGALYTVTAKKRRFLLVQFQNVPTLHPWVLASMYAKCRAECLTICSHAYCITQASYLWGADLAPSNDKQNSFVSSLCEHNIEELQAVQTSLDCRMHLMKTCFMCHVRCMCIPFEHFH